MLRDLTYRMAKFEAPETAAQICKRLRAEVRLLRSSPVDFKSS